MANRLAGKTIVLTGGASGMGAAAVELFVSEGAHVVITDVQVAKGEALAAKLGERAKFMPHNVALMADWARVVADTEKLFGPINVLVNNAGISGKHQAIDTMSEADYRAVIDVNQVGTFLGMKTVLPSMRRAGGGSIVNVASTYGLVGAPHEVDYCSSKFAVVGLTKAAAAELGPAKIRVNAIHPGPVITPLFEAGLKAIGATTDSFVHLFPLRRTAQPPELAELFLFLASDASGFCTGASFVIDGGQTAV